MDDSTVEKELNKVKKSLDDVNKTIRRSHGEIGLGVLLAVTFTFGGLLLTTKAWEEAPPWKELTPYNCIVSTLALVWMATLAYVLITRLKRRDQP